MKIKYTSPLFPSLFGWLPKVYIILILQRDSLTAFYSVTDKAAPRHLFYLLEAVGWGGTWEASIPWRNRNMTIMLKTGLSEYINRVFTVPLNLFCGASCSPPPTPTSWMKCKANLKTFWSLPSNKRLVVTNWYDQSNDVKLSHSFNVTSPPSFQFRLHTSLLPAVPPSSKSLYPGLTCDNLAHMHASHLSAASFL